MGLGGGATVAIHGRTAARADLLLHFEPTVVDNVGRVVAHVVVVGLVALGLLVLFDILGEDARAASHLAVRRRRRSYVVILSGQGLDEGHAFGRKAWLLGWWRWYDVIMMDMMVMMVVDVGRIGSCGHLLWNRLRGRRRRGDRCVVR